MERHMLRILVIILAQMDTMCRAQIVIIQERMRATVEIRVIGATKCPMFLMSVTALCRVIVAHKARKEQREPKARQVEEQDQEERVRKEQRVHKELKEH